MKKIQLSRAVECDDSWDVIVAGGGPAGCAAAAAAARAGCRTLLIEASGFLGGMGTGGLIPAWCPFSDREKIIYRGIAQEVFENLKRAMPQVDPAALSDVPIDAEKLKLVYDELVAGSGAQVLFHTQAADVLTEGGAVTAVVTASKAGLRAHSAKVYIDATGDGDLAVAAGAESVLGDGSGAASLMPASLCFTLTNVDDFAYRHGEMLFCSNPNSPIYPILKSGKYPLIPDFHIYNLPLGPSKIGFNAGHIFGVDSTDPRSTSDAMALGRRIAMSFRDALAEYAPAAFANAVLSETAPFIGIREGRRVIGDYVLTVDDYIARRSFPDDIARNAYHIDTHNKSAGGGQSPDDLAQMEANIARRYKPGESHGIPYRSLTPRGIKNMLVAGRCISCDQTVFGSVRVMPVCLVTGEAAGSAAAQLAAAGETDAHALDVAKLQQTLRRNGAYLPCA